MDPMYDFGSFQWFRFNKWGKQMGEQDRSYRGEYFMGGVKLELGVGGNFGEGGGGEGGEVGERAVSSKTQPDRFARMVALWIRLVTV